MKKTVHKDCNKIKETSSHASSKQLGILSFVTIYNPLNICAKCMHIKIIKAFFSTPTGFNLYFAGAPFVFYMTQKRLVDVLQKALFDYTCLTQQLQAGALYVITELNISN